MISFLKEKIKNKNLNFVDLIEGIPKFSNDNHYKKSIELWGKGNHSSNKDKHDGGDTHIEKIIEHFGDEDFKKENFLEIGCGEGIDLKYVIDKYMFKNVFAVDLGENIENLSKREYFNKINFIRCDCLNLPFKDNCFDIIYSYGVFHHTKDFSQSLIEAKRVLNENGVLIFYTYKEHENKFKKYGVYIETLLIKLFSKLNYKIVKVLCYILTPFILFFFSYSAQLLKMFGSKNFYKRFPLWWGTSPKNIIHDLTDRLYAPINLRFNKDSLKDILVNLGFLDISILNVRDGLFCRVKKNEKK